MELHLVTGFLGAGKTTTIINCCKMLMSQGKKVAVITNDQGKYLVDTAFIRASDIPAVDVQSGCFCSHYQDMVKQLSDLKEHVNPDIVFAEAIGSAANLVGTVMLPLIEGSDYHPDSLSAIVDSRLMLRLAKGEYLPFSDSVTATFKAQLRESNYLIINKIDLLNEENIQDLHIRLKDMYPQKLILFQNVHTSKDIMAWYHAISSKTMNVSKDLLFNPQAHTLALNKLQWSEEHIDFSDSTNVFPKIIDYLENFLAQQKAKNAVIAHIKLFIEYAGQHLKLSITSLDQDTWQHSLENLHAKSAKLIINARVQL